MTSHLAYFYPFHSMIIAVVMEGMYCLKVGLLNEERFSLLRGEASPLRVEPRLSATTNSVTALGRY
jgi:hypothetical protein